MQNKKLNLKLFKVKPITELEIKSWIYGTLKILNFSKPTELWNFFNHIVSSLQNLETYGKTKI
jgi:hypothetical protein